MKICQQIALESVRQWFEKAVLGLNLCPFAVRPYRQNAIEFVLCEAETDENCLIDLYLYLEKLDQQPDIETIVMICPNHLSRFSDYNQFLSLAENLIEQEGWAGIYQIASFHPDYQFEGTDLQERANWTNRSPFPLLHLLREDSISCAALSALRIEEIPGQNIEILRRLSDEEMQSVFGRYRYLSGQKNAG